MPSADRDAIGQRLSTLSAAQRAVAVLRREPPPLPRQGARGASPEAEAKAAIEALLAPWW